jgi:hypothetical protein
LTNCRKSVDYYLTCTTVSPLTVVDVWSGPAFPPTLGFLLETGEVFRPKEISVAKALRAKKEAKHRSFHNEHLPLDAGSFRIIGIGVIVIIAGYAAMLEGSVEGFLPLVVAPILLVVGYCVVIPAGILYRKSMFRKNAATTAGTTSKP